MYKLIHTRTCETLFAWQKFLRCVCECQQQIFAEFWIRVACTFLSADLLSNLTKVKVIRPTKLRNRLHFRPTSGTKICAQIFFFFGTVVRQNITNKNITDKISQKYYHRTKYQRTKISQHRISQFFYIFIFLA